MASLSLLQPFPILDGAWIDISMDFVKGFSLSHGKSIIFIIIDHLTSMPIFMA